MLQKISTKIQEYEREIWYLPYIYAVISNISLVLMQINIKIISQTLTPQFALYMRGVLLICLNTFMIRLNNYRIDQPCKKLSWLLIIRSIFSGISVLCLMITIAYIPIGIVNSLFNTGPIFIHFFQSYYYKKPLNTIHLIFTIICFIGIILIIKPDFLFGNIQNYALIFMMMPAFGAIFHSLSMLILHTFSNKVSNIIALEYFYISQTFFSAIVQCFHQLKWKKEISVGFGYAIVGMVLFAYSTQVFLTRAIYLKKASFIMPFGYISIVFATLSDVLFFGAHFDFVSIIGMVLTSGGLVSKIFIKENKVN